MAYLVHEHPRPQCKGNTHHASCKGKGREVGCGFVSKGSRTSPCFCVHVKKRRG